jgi:radical SAM superfamily enzyme YgiQ (UPF0313 family)
MKRILFVVPPQEIGYGYINDYFWQQGILYLASYLRKRYGSALQIEICDGNIRPIDECRRLIAAEEWDVVGFHVVDHAKRYAIELANHAVACGCKRIVFGGAGAIFGAEQYLRGVVSDDQDLLVGCCVGAGECTVDAILSGRPPREVPNLRFRRLHDDGEITIERSAVTAARPRRDEYLDILPFADYGDITTYLRSQLGNPDYPYTPITYSALSHEGCVHRHRLGDHNSGCSFCGIPSPYLQVRDPKRFWKEVASFDEFSRRAVGQPVLSIKDWGDSVTEKVIQDLLAQRPSVMSNIQYSCYLSISEITSHMLTLLQQMNCRSIYIGIDAYRDDALQVIGKSYSRAELLAALERLAGCSMMLEFGFLIGIKGETRGRLHDLLAFVHEVDQMFKGRIIVLQGNIVVPYPGSRIFSDLQSAAPKDPLFLSVQERIRLWLERFTDVTFEDCIGVQQEIEMISPRRHSYVSRREVASP